MTQLKRHGSAREILAELRRQGWTITNGKHVKAIPPDPTMPIVVCASSPSDARAIKNWLAQLKRSGFVWSREGNRLSGWVQATRDFICDCGFLTRTLDERFARTSPAQRAELANELRELSTATETLAEDIERYRAEVEQEGGHVSSKK